MKIIFLDIDGVLVTKRTLRQRALGKRVADPRCIKALNYILRETGAHIVISSAWRFCGLAEMEAIFTLWGIEGRIIGLTPDLTTYPTKPQMKRAEFRKYKLAKRGDEIQAWLDARQWGKRVQARDQIVIFDDEADMGHLAPLLIKTAFDTGLTREHAERAIRILRG